VQSHTTVIYFILVIYARIIYFTELLYLTLRVCRMQFSTTCPATWLSDVVITCVIMFLKFFTFTRIEILTHCMFTILLEASTIATDLFVIKLYTCKGFV